MDPRQELVRTVAAALPTAVIALDFDGTLSPLVDDPQQSRLAAGAAAALGDLAAAGARIAVVTGRDAGTVLRLSGLADLPGLTVSGLYGAETWHAGELTTLPDQPALHWARKQLDALLAGEPSANGVWVEDKRLSLVLHARVAADPARALATLTAPVRALADPLGLEVHPGRDVLELRLPGYDKGVVLRRLVERARPDVAVYAGDDLGDLPAFAVIADLRADGLTAWSVAAGDPPLAAVGAAADVAVSGPADLVALLVSLAEENGDEH